MEQNQVVKGIIINEDLFSEYLDEYAHQDLEYINVPDAVGIATEYNNNNRIYIIYLNNELGKNIYNKTTNSFIKAIIFARELYEGLKPSFYNIDTEIAKIKKR